MRKHALKRPLLPPPLPETVPTTDKGLFVFFGYTVSDRGALQLRVRLRQSSWPDLPSAITTRVRERKG